MFLQPVAGYAQDRGIKFDQIQPGTQFHYVSFKGRPKHVDVYTGKSKGFHIIKSYFLRAGRLQDAPFWVMYYNEAGLMVRRDKMAFKQRHEYKPFDCEQSGSRTCSHRKTVTYWDNSRRGSQSLKNFEIRQTGRSRVIIRNAKGNRLKERIKLNDLNIVIERRRSPSDISDGYKLGKTLVPR